MNGCSAHAAEQSIAGVNRRPDSYVKPRSRTNELNWTRVNRSLYLPLFSIFTDSRKKLTRLHCRWQTRATAAHWLIPTVLYIDVDGQCDKLVTETITSLPHWLSN